MKPGIGTVAALALASCAFPANAAAILGSGLASCGSFVDYSRQDDARVYTALDWVQGFVLRGSVARGLDLLGGRDAPGLRLWLEQYCTAHPLTPLWQAAYALELELKTDAKPLKAAAP